MRQLKKAHTQQRRPIRAKIKKKKWKLANPKPAYPASPIPLHGNHCKDFRLTYLKWKTNKDLLYSTWNSVQCCVATWMGREFGGEWIHICVWLNPFAVTWNYHNIVNQLNPNIKLKKKKRLALQVLTGPNVSPLQPCKAWHAPPRLRKLWITNYLFSGTHFLILIILE